MTEGEDEPATDLVTVRWEQVPPRLYLDHVAHLRDLTHELRIVHAGGKAGAAVAGEAAELVDAWSRGRGAAETQARDALDAGHDHVDLEVALPLAVINTTDRIAELLDAADELARTEQLLTLAATPELAAFRRWTAAEVRRQAHERLPPVPYPGRDGLDGV